MQLVPRSEAASDIRALAEALDQLESGELLPYKRLNEIAGRNVQFARRDLLDAACNWLLEHKKKAFGAVTRVGIKRLTDTEAIGQCIGAMKHIQRTARKSVAKALTADYDKLNPGEKLRHNGYISQLGAIAHAADSSHINRIHEKCRTRYDGWMPTSDTLKLMAS